jgi:hypothetical protein
MSENARPPSGAYQPPASAVFSLVIKDLLQADRESRIAGPVVSGDPLRDAYRHALEAAVALRQVLLERDAK